MKTSKSPPNLGSQEHSFLFPEPVVAITPEEVQKLLRDQAVLQASEENYRNLFNSMQEGFSLHDIICDSEGKPIDYRFLRVNPAFEKLTGLKATDIIGKTVLEVLPETEKYWIENFGKVALSGKPHRFDNFSKALDNDYQCFAFCPKLGQFAVVFNNISEWKRSEHLLKEEKEHLAITLRSIGDGVITTDKQGRILLINEVGEMLTGWQQSEAEGKDFERVFQLKRSGYGPSEVNPMVSDRESGKVEESPEPQMLIAKNGVERLIHCSCSPIKNNDRQTLGFVWVFRDVTEKQNVLESMHNQQKLEALGVMAGGIAHDFNNLLGGIFGYIDLAHDISKEKDVAHYLQESMKTMDRARALTLQLLTFSKGGTPIKRIGNLSALVSETVRFALRGSNVSPRFEMAPDLWSCELDMNQIGQVLENMVINAKQAMPQGGVLKILGENRVYHEREKSGFSKGPYVHLTLKDTGVGIPSDKILRIFDPFFTTKHSGNGLGLATCYSIVKKHGGKIEVESVLDQGATFHIYLPALPEIAQPLLDLVKTPVQGKGYVIVMDDDPTLREMLSAFVKSFGYKPISFPHGQKVLDFLEGNSSKKKELAAIILDLTILGGMGGLETVTRIRKLNATIPVIVSSGYSDNPIMANPKTYGFTDSLKKPYKRLDLGAILEKI